MTNTLRDARAMLQAARDAGIGMVAPLDDRTPDDEAVRDPIRYSTRVRAAQRMVSDGQGRALLSMLLDAVRTVRACATL